MKLITRKMFHAAMHDMLIVSDKAPDFVKNITSVMMADHGDQLPVSMMPVDGTYPSGTTQWEKRNVSDLVASLGT
jgi:pyruvate-ferredoxin/flavodoxin oxidoreductase